MAKNKFKSDDDFDFDKNLDFDFDSLDVDKVKKPKDDRKPAAAVARGVLKGAASTIASPATLRHAINNALPKEYGEALDFADNTVGTVKDLYNTAAKEIKPAIRQAKKTTRLIMPSVKGKLPKRLTDMMDKWSADDEAKGGGVDQREAGIAMQLDFFNAQAQQTQEQRNEDTIRDTIRESASQTRHKDQIGILSDIRSHLERQSVYQDKITINYQRKSLELKYRQYNVLTDMLEAQKQLGQIITTNLEAITKNTALPETQKIKLSEGFKSELRNRFVDGAVNSVSDLRKTFFKRLRGNLTKKVQGSVRDFSSQMTDMLSMIDQGAETVNEFKEMGMGDAFNPSELVGQSIGGIAGAKVRDIGTKHLKKYLDNNETAKNNVTGIGGFLRLMLGNSAQAMDEFKKSDVGDNGFMGWIVRALKDEIPTLTPDNTVAVDDARSMQMPSTFTNAARKSLVEIIPGYLARMYQELQIIRTGDQSIGLTLYDYDGNKFSSEGNLKKKIFDKIVSKDSKSDNVARMKGMTDLIDKDQTLSEDERKELGQFLTDSNQKNKSADPRYFSKAENYRGIDYEKAEKYASLFRKFFGMNEDGKIQEGWNAKLELGRQAGRFSDKYTELGKDVRIEHEMIQTLINLGFHDQLSQMGILDKQNQIDVSKLRDMMGNDNGPDESVFKDQSVKSGMASNRPRRLGDRARATTVNNIRNINRTNYQASSTPQPQQQANGSGELSAKLEAMLGAAGEKQDKTISLIEQIVKHLDAGININGFNTGEGGSDKKKFSQMTIGDIFNSAIDFGANAIGKAKDIFTSYWKTTKKAGNWLFDKGTLWGGKLLDKVSEVGGAIGDFILKKKDELTDLYVGSEIEPRLLAWKIKAGHYIDVNSGKVITKLEDITGDIRDAVNDAVIHFTGEDLKNCWTKTKEGAKKGISKLIAVGAQLVKSSWDMGANLYKNLFNKGTALFKWARDKLAGDDVYVVGETQPRLLAVTMRAGGYVSAVTGKTILFATQIDGAVKSTVDGEIKLSEDDLKKGIVDAEGKPFRTMLKKAVDFAISTGKKAWAMVRKGWQMVKDGAKDTWDGVRKFFNGAGIAIVAGSDIAAILKDIYKLLDARMPGKKKKIAGDADGDGDRDGSWQDAASKIKSKGSDKMDEAAQAMKDSAAATAAAVKKMKGEIAAALKEAGMGGEGESWLSSIGDVASVVDAWHDIKKGRFPRKFKPKAGGKIAKIAGKFKFGGSKLTGWMSSAGSMIKNSKLTKGIVSKGGAVLSGAKNLIKAKAPGATGLIGSAGTKLASLAKSSKGALGRGLGAAKNIGGAALAKGGGLLAGARGLATGGGLMAGAKSLAKSGARKIPIIGSLIGAGMLANTWTDKKASTKSKVEDSGDIIGGILGGMAAGAAAGAVFGGFGAIPGVIIGGFLGAKLGSKASGAAYDLYKGKTQANDKTKINSLKAYRMLQYGVNPADQAAVSKITWMESIFMKGVKWGSEGVEIDLKKVTSADFLSDFGVDINNQDHMRQWSRWAALRFAPVFKTHLTAMKALDLGKNLEEVDAGKAELKIKFLNAVAMPNGPYSKELTPFPGKECTVDKEQISTALTVLRDLFGKGEKTETAKGPSTAEIIKKVQDEKGSKDPLSAQIAKELLGDAAKEDTSKDVATTVAGALIEANAGFGRVHDDLDFLRFKTYGLTSLDKARIRSIYYLETYVKVDTKFDAKDTATWSGSVEEVVRRIGPMFGVPDVMSPEGSSFVKWFRCRFLPVYLAYAGQVKSITKSNDTLKGADKLKPDEKVRIGNFVAAVQTDYEGSTISVWKVTDSPWANYELNQNADTIKMNIENLEGDVKTAIQQERDAKNNKAPNASQAAPASGDKSATEKKLQVIARRNTNESIGANTVTAASLSGGGSGGDTSGVAGKTVSMTEGAGGLVDSLPIPAGDGYANVKPLIDAAAKMVGMDANLLTIMAAQESGFKINAKAGKGSASGLFQFVDGTWKGMLKKYGKKYGIAEDASPFDPRANAIMGALYAKESVSILRKSLKRDPTYPEIYMAHFMGPETAGQFLNQDPNAIAATLYPKAASYNEPVFYDKTKRPKTIGEVFQYFKNTMAAKVKSFKLPIDMDVSNQTASTGPGSAPAGPTSTPGDGTVVSKTDRKGIAGSTPAGATSAAPTTNTPSSGYGPSSSISKVIQQDSSSTPSTPAQQSSYTPSAPPAADSVKQVKASPAFEKYPGGQSSTQVVQGQEGVNQMLSMTISMEQNAREQTRIQGNIEKMLRELLDLKKGTTSSSSSSSNVSAPVNSTPVQTVAAAQQAAPAATPAPAPVPVSSPVPKQTKPATSGVKERVPVSMK